jgi:hypothetical protein
MGKDHPLQKSIFWIWVIALINVAVHLCFYNTLGFHRDELLYFSLGRHLSAGYASLPPFTGLMAWVMIKCIGSTLFAARLLPAVFSGILVLVVSGITKEMKGGVHARILAAVGVLLLPINLRAFYFFMPVFFDVFFWTLLFYLVILWINSKKDIFILLIGIISGIGIMNKYLILLQLFCIAIVLVFSPDRELFFRKSFRVAILLALILVSPNIIWQVSNHFPAFTHMHALRDSQLVHVDRMAFLSDQLFIMFVAVFFVFPGILFFLLSRKMKPYRLLVIASLMVVLILWLLRGKNYYTAGIYPFLIATGAVYWETVLKSRISRVLFVSILVLLTVPVVPAGIPILPAKELASGFAWEKQHIGMGAFLRDEKGVYHALPQDYADMLGWDELTVIAAKAYRQVDKSSCFFYCENYGQAGAITVLGKDRGLPEPVCFSESFFYWAPRELPVNITSIIYINDTLGEDIRHLFPNIRIIGKVSNPLAREYGTTVYLGTNPVTSFNAFYRKRIREITNPF